MRLLVSVANAEEASAALEGGADVIDAKDARAGALGAVARDVLQEIYAVVNRARPVTAALGDAADEAAIERDARLYAAAGAGTGQGWLRRNCQRRPRRRSYSGGGARRRSRRAQAWSRSRMPTPRLFNRRRPTISWTLRRLPARRGCWSTPRTSMDRGCARSYHRTLSQR